MCIVISTLFERENMSELLIANRPLSQRARQVERSASMFAEGPYVNRD